MKPNSTAIEELLNEFVNRMIDAAGKNLESIILFGSAAKNEAKAPIGDLNLLCTLKSSDSAQLAKISAVVAWWTTGIRQPAPMIFESHELAASADVFAIEFCDMQTSHRALFGPDHIENLQIPMNMHRVQVEHELRTTILKLRQLYLRSVAEPKLLATALAKSLSTAKTLLRHALIVAGEEVPQSETAIFERAAAFFSIEASPFSALARLRLEPNAKLDLNSLFDQYLSALEKIAVNLDAIPPSRV